MCGCMSDTDAQTRVSRMHTRAAHTNKHGWFSGCRLKDHTSTKCQGGQRNAHLHHYNHENSLTLNSKWIQTNTHARTHGRTHTCTHTRAFAHTHTHYFNFLPVSTLGAMPLARQVRRQLSSNWGCPASSLRTTSDAPTNAAVTPAKLVPEPSCRKSQSKARTWKKIMKQYFR